MEATSIAGLRKRWASSQHERSLLYSGSSGMKAASYTSANAMAGVKPPQLLPSPPYHSKLLGDQSQSKVEENAARGQGSMSNTQLSRMVETALNLHALDRVSPILLILALLTARTEAVPANVLSQSMPRVFAPRLLGAEKTLFPSSAREAPGLDSVFSCLLYTSPSPRD